MSDTSRLKFHSSVAICAILAVGGLRIVKREWYAEEFRRAGRGASARGALEKEQSWQRLPYVDVSKVPLAEVLDQRIGWAALNLTSNQTSKLRKRLGEVASYLQNPTFLQYYQLRTEGLAYRFRMRSDWQTSLMGTVGPNGNDQKKEIELFWNRVHLRDGRVTPPRISAVCPIDIAAAISQTNSVHSLIFGKVAKCFAAFVEQLNPGFTYATPAEKQGDATREGPFFHLSFYVKVNGSERAGPVYLSLSWLPLEETWAPAGLVTEKCLRVETVF